MVEACLVMKTNCTVLSRKGISIMTLKGPAATSIPRATMLLVQPGTCDLQVPRSWNLSCCDAARQFYALHAPLFPSRSHATSIYKISIPAPDKQARATKALICHTPETGVIAMCRLGIPAAELVFEPVPLAAAPPESAPVPAVPATERDEAQLPLADVADFMVAEPPKSQADAPLFWPR